MISADYSVNFSLRFLLYFRVENHHQEERQECVRGLEGELAACTKALENQYYRLRSSLVYTRYVNRSILVIYSTHTCINLCRRIFHEKFVVLVNLSKLLVVFDEIINEACSFPSKEFLRAVLLAPVNKISILVMRANPLVDGLFKWLVYHSVHHYLRVSGLS